MKYIEWACFAIIVIIIAMALYGLIFVESRSTEEVYYNRLLVEVEKIHQANLQINEILREIKNDQEGYQGRYQHNLATYTARYRTFDGWLRMAKTPDIFLNERSLLLEAVEPCVKIGYETVPVYRSLMNLCELQTQAIVALIESKMTQINDESSE